MPLLFNAEHNMNTWLLPPEHLRLMPHEAHVWSVQLENFFGRADELLECLSAEEVQQSQRFVNAQLTNSYIIAHALLRHVLARYVDCKPEALLIEKNPQGKPYLAHQNLEFNMSHTRGVALYAVSHQAVGIDIELLARDMQIEDIAERFFTENEYKKICALDPGDRQAAFYRCWTLKEAFIKALGHGLTYGLDRFEVDFMSEGSRCLKNVEDPLQNPQDWDLRPLFYSQEYAAALATQGALNGLQCFTLS